MTEEEARAKARQQTLFATIEDEAEAQADAKERKMQEAVLGIKARFGKNAILRGTSLEEGATAIERNQQIGGHRA